MSSQIFSYTNHSKFSDPEIFVSGNNDTVTNAKGKTYIDCNSGLWNVNFGYNNTNYDQCLNVPLHFYPTHFWSSTEITELAAKAICQHFGYSKVFFGHSGSDAIDTAIYISKYFNQKNNILAYKNGYHGSTLDAQVYDCYSDLIQAINNDTSAVLIEPIMITNGVVEFDQDVLEELFYLRKRYNFNIIFDETVTGLGRADYSFDWHPDLLITSKGLTNGVFPLSAVLVNEEIADYIKNTDKVFSHGYTMSGHPIACNALLKTIELLNSVDIENVEKQFVNMINKQSIPYIQKGLVFGLKVKDGIKSRRLLQKEGYLIRQSNNILLFLPMFIANTKNYISFFEQVATFLE
jgi:adenosylmethionine-8-amino-7-oxononanoate aminotransferase